MTRKSTNHTTDAISRRDFIRNTAAGATSAALLLGGPGRAVGKSTESGLVTLDALILLYFGAPLGQVGTSSFPISPSYDFTLNLQAVEAPTVFLRGNGPLEEERIHRSEFNQIRSALVSDAITSRLHRTELVRIGSGSDGTFDGTIALAMLKPQFEFTGNPNRLRFRFVDVGDTLTFDIQGLRNGGVSGIRNSTASSFLEVYVTDPSLLVEPRFMSVRSLEFSGQQTLDATVKLRAGTPGSEAESYTAEIVESSGFNSDSLRSAFAAGKRLRVTLSSAQEFKSTIKVSATVNRTTPGVTRIFFDKVFKTFVIANSPRPTGD